MKNKEESQFPWSLLFIVTALSFFAFSGFVKLINGSPDHAALFFKVAIFSSVASVLAFIGELSVKLVLKESNDSSSSEKD